jgi:hypothetical protein
LWSHNDQDTPLPWRLTWKRITIDDPLTDECDIDPKTRLNDPVYRLNRKQLTCLHAGRRKTIPAAPHPSVV